MGTYSKKLTKPINIGGYVEINIDGVVYPARISGVDYLKHTVTLDIDWKIEKEEEIRKGSKVRITHGDYAGVVGTIEEIDNHGGYSLIAVSEDSPRMANEKYIWAITDFLEEVK